MANFLRLFFSFLILDFERFGSAQTVTQEKKGRFALQRDVFLQGQHQSKIYARREEVRLETRTANQYETVRQSRVTAQRYGDCRSLYQLLGLAK